MLFAAPTDEAQGFFGCVGVLYLIFLIVSIFSHITLMKAIQACAPRNQAMAPGLVWLNFVPCLNLVWQFVNVIQVGNSLQAEYQDRGRRSDDQSFGKTLGLSYIILNSVASGISFVGQSVIKEAGEEGLALSFLVLQAGLGITQFVLWIVYWVKIARLTRESNSSSRRSLYDDDDDGGGRDLMTATTATATTTA